MSRTWTSGNIEANLIPDTGSDPVPLRIGLHWTAKEPWLVTALIGNTTEWRLSRDVLIDGLTFRSGEGDVELVPVSPSEVELSVNGMSRDGVDTYAVMRMPTARLRAFLDRTETIVPRGAEVMNDRFDAELADLMERS